VPNLVSNHLTTGLLHYIRTTGRYASGINLFEKLRSRDTEISSLLAQVLISADEEVKAVRLLHDAVDELPMDYALLGTQAQFCHDKGKNEMALELAKRAVVSAPSEFGTWARLAEVYIALEQWDLALLTLNSCPMFTYQDKDMPRMTTPDRVHLPIMPESACDEIDEAQPTGDVDVVHPTLRKLVAATFKGTFEKAYALLTEITKKIGWDQLLRVRSQVFVMEEEYRNEKQTGPPQQRSRNASTIALNGEATNAAGSSSTSLGTENTAVNGEDAGLEKPAVTVASEAVKAGSDNVEADPEHKAYTSFKHKRLCERWLDNLFMVLYEDLRVYTIWRTEMSQYKQQQLQYKKAPEEWEILGELAERLHHNKEGVEAYQQCLATKFSPRAMKGVLSTWQREGDIRSSVGALIRLICWQYRWYSEVCCRQILYRQALANNACVVLASTIRSSTKID
jgi:tetratricopeptide (TPR) repeat protein